MSKKRLALLLLPRVAWGVVFVIAQYLIVFVTIVGCFVLFKLMNRTIIHGKHHGKLRPGLFLISNHQSLIDSFLVAYAVCVPTIFWNPSLVPWHLPDRKNFFSNPLLRPLMRLWRAIPVDRENGGAASASNLGGNRQVMRVLKRGVVHAFLEGTRSPNDCLLPPKVRVAKFVLQTGSAALLVYFDGMHGVQPYYKSPDDMPWTPLHLFGKPGRHLAWIFRALPGNTILVGIDEAIEREEITRLAGEGTLAEQAERLAHSLMTRLEKLRDRVHSSHSSPA